MANGSSWRWILWLAIWALCIAIANPTQRSTLLVSGCVVTAMVTALGYVSRRNRQLASDNQRGIDALARGELATARDIFARLAEAGSRRVAAVARDNLAVVLMREGKHAEAIEVASIESGYTRPAELVAMNALELSMLCALVGRLADARVWLARAHAFELAPAIAARRTFVHALVDCRAGRLDAAASELADHWTECERGLTERELRHVRVVRAYAIASRGPREAGVADAILAPAKPVAFRGEYTFLGAAWPEMAAFLAAHDLA